MTYSAGVSLPSRILIKRGAAGEIDGVLRDLKLGRRCAFFCDKTAMAVIGSKIVKSISGSFDVEVFDASSPDADAAKKASGKVQAFDFCMAVGGGRTIDVCKYAAWLAGKPWVSFPTIPSHDGVVSSRASLEESGKRVSLDAGEPAAIVADLDVLRAAPYRFVAAGAGDCLSNISAVEDWKRAGSTGAERYQAVIGGLSLLASQAVMSHAREIAAQDFHGLEVLMWSLVCSGFAMNIYGSSRPASGSEHNFSHALDALGSKALHGEQVALGTLVSLYLQGEDWRSVREVMKILKLPTTAEELGIGSEMAIKALVAAKGVRKRRTVLDEAGLDEEKARYVLRAVGVI
ncbi:MAG: iron-containing alcohol dehydrogenase [Candidatus Aenigmatarchaeota archaeon]